MRKLGLNPNVDNSDLVNFPNGRIKDNTGAGDGTAVSERTKGDMHQFFEKVMRLYGITSNELPDNETNGFQLVDAVRALASKNDFILSLGSVSGIITVPIKLGLMLDNESVICLSTINLTTETQIKGSDGVILSITNFGVFKTNEYVRLIKTASTVNLVRITDSVSLDLMASEFLYLKKATQAEENAGAIDTKATTPLTNLVAFTKRVIGLDSGGFLASTIRNGLMSIADKIKLDNLASPKNIGWFSGLDVGATTGSLPVSGDISSVNASSPTSSDTIVTVNLVNTMTGTNYYVRAYLQGQNSDINLDNDVCAPVFKPLSSTQFQIAFREVSPVIQSLKIHIEVVQL